MDECSFPFITATVEDSLFRPPFPHFISSPSSEGALDRNVRSLEDAGPEEGMDMLWEIFNEDLVWISYDKIQMAEELNGEEISLSSTELGIDDSESDVPTDGVAAEACSLRKAKIRRTRSKAIRRTGRSLLKFLSSRKDQKGFGENSPVSALIP